MSYTQLTQEQRYQIYALLKTGCSQTKIAETVEVGIVCGFLRYDPVVQSLEI